MNNEQHEPLVPVGVGNSPAQQRFLQGHQRYLDEVPKLVELCNKVFDRTLTPPDEGERQALLDLNLPRKDGREVLAEIKAAPRLKDMVLVKNSRLSVQPVTAAEWQAVSKMAGLE